ncbi:MAG: hypothetical protein LBI29_03995 [Rickettsiales bacterium]|jgi:hypothetical protein|nr:hypothetical protein [Rickettsiales bacterium]
MMGVVFILVVLGLGSAEVSVGSPVALAGSERGHRFSDDSVDTTWDLSEEEIKLKIEELRVRGGSSFSGTRIKKGDVSI